MENRNKIYYRHGTMYSGKSTDLIKSYLSDQRNKKVLAIKPSLDTRDDEITSRIINATIPCIRFDKEESIIGILKYYFDKHSCVPDVIYIDEVQFLTEKQVAELHDITAYCPVICYGLKTSFTGDLFPAISTLYTYAEDVKEIKHTCWMCKSKATYNLLVRNGKPIYNGDMVNIEGANNDDKYYAVCREHFFNPEL